jgi:mannose/fructose/N-acetylgalactosamine-specific phosphotransferase system component IIB
LPSKNSIQTSYSGRFEILDFDIEKQFVNLIMKLRNIGNSNKRESLSNQVGSLIKMEDEDYKAIEKITQQGLL